MSKEITEQQKAFLTIGFLSPIFIECIDKLQGTKEFRGRLKQGLNIVLSELESFNDKFYTIVREEDQKDIEKNIEESKTLDVYNQITNFYEFGVKLFTETKPNEMSVIMEQIQEIMKKDLSQEGVYVKRVER